MELERQSLRAAETLEALQKENTSWKNKADDLQHQLESRAEPPKQNENAEIQTLKQQLEEKIQDGAATTKCFGQRCREAE